MPFLTKFPQDATCILGLLGVSVSDGTEFGLDSVLVLTGLARQKSTAQLRRMCHPKKRFDSGHAAKLNG